MTITSNDSNIWNTALKLEGLDGFAGHIEDHEIDMVTRAMSILAEEGIEIRNALEEHIEHGDQHSGMKLRNVLRMSHLSHLFPQEEGTTMEVYSAHLLEQVE